MLRPLESGLSKQTVPQDHIKSDEKENNRWCKKMREGFFGNLRWATKKEQSENQQDREFEDTPQELMEGEFAWDVLPSWGEMGDPDGVDEQGWPKKKKKKKKRR